MRMYAALLKVIWRIEERNLNDRAEESGQKGLILVEYYLCLKTPGKRKAQRKEIETSSISKFLILYNLSLGNLIEGRN